MVFPDVDGASSDGFNSNQYSSDDTYASPSSYRFDATSLPQPIPVLGPFLGFSSTAVRFKTESALKFAEQKVGRKMNLEESQALAYHIYKLEQTKSYFTSVGGTLGCLRWYTTFDECRYPMYKPKLEDINPNKFLFVRGPLAQYARHSWRLFAYLFVAAEAGKILGQLVAQPLAARDTAQDPKLAQFGKDLMASFSEGPQRTPAPAREVGKEWRERIERERNPERMRRATPAPARNDDDNMSPTAGNEPWGSLSGSWSDSSSSSDSSQTTPEQRPSTIGAWTRRPAPPHSDDNTDASPTGGFFEQETRSQNQSKPVDSAWERLRRGGGPTTLQGQRPTHRSGFPRGERKEESTLGDSFTFVEDDDERRNEREKAQREFDARIERERQGKDFNDGEKRW